MRKWIGLILTVLLIIAFLPAGLGILAKKSLDQLVAELPMPDGTTLTLQDYTFGWLSSYVAIKIHVSQDSLHAHYLTDKFLDIVVHGHIAHGPLLMTDRGIRPGIARMDTHATLKDIKGFNVKTEQELALLFKDNDLIRASSLFQLTKGITIDLKSSPINAQVLGDEFQWNGFNAHIKINHDFDKVHTDLIISPMLMTTTKGAILDTAQAKFIAHLYREKDSIWVGEQVFSIPTFYLKDEAGSVLRFDHLKIMSHSNIIDQLLQATLNIEADNINLDNQTIEKLQLDIELTDFASEPLLALSKLMQQPQPWNAEQKQEGFNLMTIALSPGADIELDYQINMQNDRVLLQGALNFPDIRDTATTNQAENAKQLFQHLNAHFEFSAPQSVFKDLLFDMTFSALIEQMGQQTPSADQEVQLKQMIENQIASLVQNNILVVKDNTYFIEFDYQQGQMVLNSKPITQGEIFLLLMLLLQVTPDESPAH